jgi:hypothetical protein
MYQSKSEPNRSFGSAFRGKRFDAHHAGEQPEVESTPKEEGSTSADVAKVTSPVVAVHFVHDHAGNKHTVTSRREDGTSDVVSHGSAKEAHDSAAQLALEAGGEDQNVSPKKSLHPDQQGADSEERGYEEFDTV